MISDFFYLSDKIKERYIELHQKHKIHAVDHNNRIVVIDKKIDDFAVKLTISRELPTKCNYRDETRQHFERLEGLKGDDIEMSNLIDEEHRVTFVRGIAGMGKSVLAKQLTYLWAKGDIYNNFKLCVMFECRELNYFMEHEGTKMAKHEVIAEFLKRRVGYDLGDGEMVLFVVDGLDELIDINKDDSIIFDFLDIHRNYGRSKAIVTGRPHVEYKLEGYGIDMGGVRKVEILGLDDDQIQEYINKFASCQNDVSLAKKSRRLIRRNLSILHVPQFLNTYCCVTILTDEETMNDQCELYCWTVYLLLRQHADKQGQCFQNVPHFFAKFSRPLVALTKVCHDLLTENKIIFEGSIESLLRDTVIGNEFIQSFLLMCQTLSQRNTNSNTYH